MSNKKNNKKVLETFKLDGKVALATGGAGLYGLKHICCLQV